MQSLYKGPRYAAFVLAFILTSVFGLQGQQSNSTSVVGSVVDPSGAVVSGATVTIANPVSSFSRTTVTDASGRFIFPNVPFNKYHVSITSQGFAAYAQDIDVRATVPVTVTASLQVNASAESVTVEAAGEDLLESTSLFHTDISKDLIDRLPLESQSSSVSSLVTLSTPGISSDSNGLFHGMGDHAENSFSVDGQPITDQQSKVFSNQIPLDSIDSMEVVTGAPPAEYGEKTSVVINVTTRSGQGMTKPKGSVTASYGSFGSSSLGFNLGYGGKSWGNYVSVNGLNTGRFLDPPEFEVFHSKGNQENVFDRVDLALSKADTIHMNFGFTRSWFQNPNSFDNVNVVDQNGNALGSTDQRSQIKTYNVAPSWTHILSNNTVFTLGGFVRHDQYNYYASPNPLADFSPIQQETLGQDRRLSNAGIRSDVSYVKGAHNLKAGVTYQQTFLTENDSLGIVDPGLLPSLTDNLGSPCFVAGAAVAAPCTALLPIDLTRGGSSFAFHGHTDVKQLAAYLQDQISLGNWSFSVGLRDDSYHGLVIHNEVQPRLGLAYNIKKSNTMLRLSYARTLETPFNENLVISSTGCGSAVLSPLLSCNPGVSGLLSPGFRNEFHAGLQQAFGKYLVFSGEYVWKYTHNAYDFSVLGNTPIYFPIAWHNSKIPGFAGRVSVPAIHGFSGQVVFSTVAARFFTPQVGGAGATPFAPNSVFRIDHDEKFNQTTHLQYQPWQKGPWFGFNWRYDSGSVAGAVPFATSSDPNDPGYQVDLTGLSADQQRQAGLFCGSVRPTLSSPLTSCPGNLYGSTLISIPAPGTENPDRNPPRIAARHLFDIAIGDDNLFHNDKYPISAQLTVVNIANEVALYNFLSTFSGTHYVSPRAITGQLTFHF